MDVKDIVYAKTINDGVQLDGGRCIPGDSLLISMGYAVDSGTVINNNIIFDLVRCF